MERDPAAPTRGCRCVAGPTFAEEVAHETEVIGQVFAGLQLRIVPAGRIGMNSIHEGRIVAHLGWHGAQEVTNLLLLLYIDVEISDHDDAALGADALFAAAELARSHVALHDIDAVLLVEGNPGNLIEADDVILADQAALPARIVHEHLCDCRFAARNQMGIRRYLLEQVAFAGSARSELDEVVVPFNERDHAQQDDTLCAFVESALAQDQWNAAKNRSIDRC